MSSAAANARRHSHSHRRDLRSIYLNKCEVAGVRPNRRVAAEFHRIDHGGGGAPTPPPASPSSSPPPPRAQPGFPPPAVTAGGSPQPPPAVCFSMAHIAAGPRNAEPGASGRRGGKSAAVLELRQRRPIDSFAAALECLVLINGLAAVDFRGTGLRDADVDALAHHLALVAAPVARIDVGDNPLLSARGGACLIDLCRHRRTIRAVCVDGTGIGEAAARQLSRVLAARTGAGGSSTPPQSPPPSLTPSTPAAATVAVVPASDGPLLSSTSAEERELAAVARLLRPPLRAAEVVLRLAAWERPAESAVAAVAAVVAAVAGAGAVLVCLWVALAAAAGRPRWASSLLPRGCGSGDGSTPPRRRHPEGSAEAALDEVRRLLVELASPRTARGVGAAAADVTRSAEAAFAAASGRVRRHGLWALLVAATLLVGLGVSAGTLLALAALLALLWVPVARVARLGLGLGRASGRSPRSCERVRVRASLASISAAAATSSALSLDEQPPNSEPLSVRVHADGVLVWAAAWRSLGHFAATAASASASASSPPFDVRLSSTAELEVRVAVGDAAVFAGRVAVLPLLLLPTAAGRRRHHGGGDAVVLARLPPQHESRQADGEAALGEWIDNGNDDDDDDSDGDDDGGGSTLQAVLRDLGQRERDERARHGLDGSYSTGVGARAGSTRRGSSLLSQQLLLHRTANGETPRAGPRSLLAVLRLALVANGGDETPAAAKFAAAGGALTPEASAELASLGPGSGVGSEASKASDIAGVGRRAQKRAAPAFDAAVAAFPQLHAGRLLAPRRPQP